MNIYILIVSDTKESIAYDKAIYWYNNKKWPLFKTTHNKNKITKHDRFLVYIAGENKNSQSFISELLINDIEVCRTENNLATISKKYGNSIHSYLCIDKVLQFTSPVFVENIKNKLNFIKDKNGSSGAYFRGGCKLLSLEDYSLIKNYVNLDLI